MINEPFGEDVRAAFPIDVAAPAREEAGHGVAAQVVDPAFVAELAHEGVDPGEACLAEFPALEPFFGEGGVDGVAACGEAGAGGDGAGEVPGDEAAGGVVVHLRKGVAEGGLGAEVHVAE